MIVFDLECRASAHRFEGWFGSSAEFEQQRGRGLVTCPVCGSGDVVKAVMAPHVGRKGNQSMAQATPDAPAVAPALAQAVAVEPAAAAPPLPPQAVAALRAFALAQAEALKASTWVGDKFADDVRAMHYGDKAEAQVHGRTSPEEARALIDEGIDIAPVIVPFAPPGEVN
ncbi:DUF1178 family protein [Novosphingobium sp.]|uniref:DUF1178 family protein n=1 Tax=Novosphingobium sp. TaxID=1874826 RepID=UPI0038BC2B22